MSGQTLLSATKVSKSYEADGRTVTALREVDLEVARGDITVIMGLSGSGKSTLLRMFNRLIAPTSGIIAHEGQDLAALSGDRLRQLRNHQVSMIFQHFGLLPHRSALDNAAFGLKLRGVSRTEARERAAEALSLVGLEGWSDSKPGELSGGMQQRVGLARALATGAEVLLMDEPFSALDPLIRHDMQTMLLEIVERLGRTIVFVTHDLDEAVRLGNRIAILDQGRIAQVGTAEEIILRPANAFVSRFTSQVNRAVALTAADVMTSLGEWSGPVPDVEVDARIPLAETLGPLHARDAVAVVAQGTPIGILPSAAVLDAVRARPEGEVA